MTRFERLMAASLKIVQGRDELRDLASFTSDDLCVHASKAASLADDAVSVVFDALQDEAEARRQ